VCILRRRTWANSLDLGFKFWKGREGKAGGEEGEKKQHKTYPLNTKLLGLKAK